MFSSARIMTPLLSLFLFTNMAFSGITPESGWEPVTKERVESNYPPFRWQTSFGEFEVGRHAPLNACGVVGVPHQAVQAFGHQMYIRYSEFIASFRIEHEGKEIKPYLLDHFQQRALDGYLPAIVSEFTEGEIRYEVSYLSAPSEPQPVDLIRIQLKNQGTTEAQGALLFNLDGAPSLEAKGEVIEDRGKPLVVLAGMPEEIRQITRDCGAVDPRCTPAGGTPFNDVNQYWRDGFYGMPVEYMLKVESGTEYPVYVSIIGNPVWICFGEPWNEPRAMTISVEGAQPAEFDGKTERDLPGNTPKVYPFKGKDLDGDGYIKVSSRAKPESRQPANLNGIWLFPPGTPDLSPSDLLQINKANLPINWTTGAAPPTETQAPSWPKEPLYRIPCGANAPTWNHDATAGEDPTWKALSLRYTPVLEPGETKEYLVKIPAIDRVELMAYGNSYHPYDTGQSWMRNLEPRHPENSTAYGEDVPQGTDPAQYAAFGPKPKDLWEKQLAVCQKLTWDEGHTLTKTYWDAFLDKRVRFQIPDEDLENLYKTQLAILDLYLLDWSGYGITTQMCGPFNYWDMCLRDGSYQIRAWDMVGYTGISEKLCNSLLLPRSKVPASRWSFGQWDDEENLGMWRTRPGQWDGQGQTMGALAEHYLFTGDKAYLSHVEPALERGAEWIEKARQRQRDHIKDPNHYSWGLLPSGVLEAGGEGHPYYIDAYCNYGLRQAAHIAAAANKTGTANRLISSAEEYAKAIRHAASLRFVRFNDFCGTLSVDPEDQKNLGTWPGSSLVYPLEVFNPFDPLIDGWYRYQEAEAAQSGGLLGFPYIFTDWAISYIRRGQPDRFVDLFNVYVDTASKMMGWSEGQALDYEFTEFTPPRKGIRGGGDMPHGEGCSNYIIMLRNLFLHEEGDTLHIAPATPRRWMAQSQSFGVEDGPTYFGKVTFDISPSVEEGKMKCSVKLDATRKPSKVLLHLRTPKGEGLRQVQLDGKPWKSFMGDTVVIANPPRRFTVEAEWK